MKRTGRLRKQIITFTLTAAVAISAGTAGSGFVSQAAYIQYDNIIVRDAPETGNVIEGLNAGVEVTVLDTANGSDGRAWNQVEYTVNGTTHRGWVRADLMSESAPAQDSNEGNTADKDGETGDQNDTAGQEDGADSQKDQNKDTSDEQKDADANGADNSSDAGTQKGADTSADVSAISGDGYLADGDDTFLVRGESLKISGEFSDSDIPEGFEKVQITYNGQEVNAVKAEHGEMFLVYLTGEKDGAFYVLDTERNCVFSFIRLTAGDASIILALPPQSEAVSEDYEKTIFATDAENGITAYQFAQDQETMKIDIVPEEYYYLYAMTDDGTYGWYLYDNGEKTFIRATTDLTKNISDDSQEAQKEQQQSSLEKMIVLGAGIVFLILLILVVTFGVRCRRMKKKLPEDDSEMEEEDEEEYMTRAERRRERRRYRHFMDEEEENFEDDMMDDMEEDSSHEEADAEKGEDVLVLNGEDYDWLDEEDDSDDPDAVLDKQPAEKKGPEKKEKQKAQKKVSKPDADADDDWDDELEFLDLK